MAALTELTSIRLSPEQRAHLRKTAEILSEKIKPKKLTDSDVIRILIERDMRQGLDYRTAEVSE